MMLLIKFMNTNESILHVQLFYESMSIAMAFKTITFSFYNTYLKYINFPTSHSNQIMSLDEFNCALFTWI